MEKRRELRVGCFRVASFTWVCVRVLVLCLFLVFHSFLLCWILCCVYLIVVFGFFGLFEFGFVFSFFFFRWCFFEVGGGHFSAFVVCWRTAGVDLGLYILFLFG